MRADLGAQWASFRHDLVVKELREMIVRSVKSGVQGISMFCECAPDNPTDYLNYRAFDYFSQTYPIRTMEQFMADEAAPVLGGLEQAHRFFEIFRNDECSDATIDEIRKIAANMPVGAYACWAWLANWLQQSRVRDEYQVKIKDMGIDEQIGWLLGRR